jgi:hypothetical protein
LLGEDTVALRPQVLELCRHYVTGFGSTNTGLVYHHRLDGPRGVGALSSPADIAQGLVNGKAMPYGYGSGIQDVALENGQLLFALCEAHEATGEALYADTARCLFRSLRRLAEITPEPGFVPRGPHPDGHSYYRDSSRDQHAAYVEALWRFSHSPLATDDDKRFVAETLGKIAARMERNVWKILVEDNSHQAHVGFTWLQHTTVGAITLLSVLGAVKDATGEAHWRKLYDDFSAERDGVRWKKHLHPSAVAFDQPLTLYSNQFDQSLVVLQRTETEPQRREQIAELLRCRAERALDANVFAPSQWRRLDWAGERDEAGIRALLKPLGLTPDKPATALDLYRNFDRNFWTSGTSASQALVQKLCYGLATVPLHKALLSEDPALVRRAEPVLRAMVSEFLRYHSHYERGENFNRTVILGLLLDARLAGGTRGQMP